MPVEKQQVQLGQAGTREGECCHGNMLSKARLDPFLDNCNNVCQAVYLTLSSGCSGELTKSSAALVLLSVGDPAIRSVFLSVPP